MPYDDTIPGWASKDDLETIEKLANGVPEGGLIVEVGSFLGRTAAAWALSAPFAAVMCIDLWHDLPVSEERIPTLSGSIPSGAAHSLDLFKHYTRNCGNIIAMQMNSLIALPRLEESADIVFIDGFHSDPVVTMDVYNAIQAVKPGGIVCGHDFDLKYPDVIRAVHRQCQMDGLTLEFGPTGSSIWIIRNVGIQKTLG